MKTKEDILDEYSVGVAAGQYTIDCDKAHEAMLAYAKQTAIDYAHWLFRRIFPSMVPTDVTTEAEQLFDKYLQEKDKV